MSIASALGDMYGERAVQAPFGVVAASYDGVSRVAGTLLAPMCKSDTWERWRGTMILIPRLIEVANLKEMKNARLETMCLEYLGMDNYEEHVFWRKQWPKK